MAYIIFNENDSRNMGVSNILNMPLASKAEQKSDILYIPGRPEPIIDLKESFNPVSYVVEMEIKTGTNIRNILSWLSGSGKLIFSDEPDKYYNAYSNSVVSTSRTNNKYYSMSVKFLCQPFAYAIDNDPIEITTNNYALEVRGSYYSEPIYKIFGSGNITLKVNNTDKPLKLYDIDSYVTVDTSLLVCHKDKVFVKNSGFLPYLGAGTNLIQWGGNVSKIEVTKNERWK
ncbi:MAG: phage tail family protein [Oscillospiraceae bacterium]|nr:phage tail family protein [Oscillospiraceae bacterium]